MISREGEVVKRLKGFKRLLLCIALIAFGLSVSSFRLSSIPVSAVIQIDSHTTFQTITGWEASAFAGEGDIRSYKASLFRKVVKDLGLTRVRVGIRSGTENPVDIFIPGVPLEGQGSVIVNDNDDPNVINPAGFQFSSLDYSIDTIVLGLRKRLKKQHEKLFLNVCYVDFGSSAFEHKDYPEEYAEFVLATYQHLDKKYGFVPDAWEVTLEPENSDWSADQIANGIVAAGRRLQANGYTPHFIAPSNASMDGAVSYFDRIIRNPEVRPYLSEFAYHRYRGVSKQAIEAIGERAIQFGINTGMLEHIGAGYQELHEDLKIGRNSAWQQFTLAGRGSKDKGLTYFLVDDHDPKKPKVTMGSRTKFLRQYFKFIRPGAVRINATSSDKNLDPLAFINRNGKYVVVIQANSAGSFSIQGLPSGKYSIKFTTASQYDVDLPKTTLQFGQKLDASIPDKGVITVYATK